MGSQAKHQGMLRSLLVLALSAFAISLDGLIMPTAFHTSFCRVINRLEQVGLNPRMKDHWE